MKQSLPEYHNLTAAEKESLVKEYNEYLVDKKVSVRMSTQGKISDITQTFKAVKEEV